LLWGIPLQLYGCIPTSFGGTRTISQSIITGGIGHIFTTAKHPLIGIITSKCEFFLHVRYYIYMACHVMATAREYSVTDRIGTIRVIISSLIYYVGFIIRSLSVYREI